MPCVSGALGIKVDHKQKSLVTEDGRIFVEGDLITLDGTTGEVLEGQVPLVSVGLMDSFYTLMKWSDEYRDIGIRVNADTPQDAGVASKFGIEGIGLCRTEHMFFAEERLTVLREAIFAQSSLDRATALERILPMQRNCLLYTSDAADE